MGFKTYNYVFPAGEKSKSIDTYADIINFLVTNHIARSDYLIALGGGVVGDITGFVAATYQRGMRYIQMPTTVLSMVDSSVGGKTAIDMPGGKNLIGAFHQSNLVLCDIELLNSLPDEIFRDGCAEIIKYAILFDKELFKHLKDKGLEFDREYVIHRCVDLKRSVIENDEFDLGQRHLLNLGHTIGHSIESISNYQISHGNAVALGTQIISCSAHHLDLCAQETVSEIVNLFREFGFVQDVLYSPEELMRYILSDKKRTGNNINLVMPVEIGKCHIRSTPIIQLQSILEAGLALWT
jgi:3-dehydroquinate synthase